MQKKLSIKINSGNLTCANMPGKFCVFLGAVKFGLVPVCRLFPSTDRSYTFLEDKDGWVQRCDECLQNDPEQQKKEEKAIDALIGLCLKSDDIQGDSEKIFEQMDKDKKAKPITDGFLSNESPKLEVRNWKNRTAP